MTFINLGIPAGFIALCSWANNLNSVLIYLRPAYYIKQMAASDLSAKRNKLLGRSGLGRQGGGGILLKNILKLRGSKILFYAFSGRYNFG